MGAKQALAKEAIAAMRETYERVVRGDWEGYSEMLAQDYVSVGPDGKAKGREETVGSWRDAAEVLRLEVEPIIGRHAGEVVFVFAKYRCIDRKKRGPQEGQTREYEGSFFEVWMPTESGWRCLATHFT